MATPTMIDLELTEAQLESLEGATEALKVDLEMKEKLLRPED
jgi:hypothetical protein